MSLVRGLCVAGPRPLRPRSVVVVSLVLGRCVPGPWSLRSRSAALPSPVRTFPRDLRRHTLCRPLSRPRSRPISRTGDSTSPDLQHHRPPVPPFRPRSVALPSQVRTFPWDLRRHTLSRPLSRPRFRPISRTGDSTPPDLQHHRPPVLHFRPRSPNFPFPVSGTSVPGPHFPLGPATPYALQTTFPSPVPHHFPDLGQYFFGLGTEPSRTCDGPPLDRGRPRQGLTRTGPVSCCGGPRPGRPLPRGEAGGSGPAAGRWSGSPGTGTGAAGPSPPE